MTRVSTILAAGAALGLAACRSLADPRSPDWSAGTGEGVYIIYNLGCDRGCEGIERGDRLLTIDGKAVSTSTDVADARLDDGAPHRLELRSPPGDAIRSVEIVATPNHGLPPLDDVPPFWTVGAAQLDRAPAWARRRMFAHASPMVQLVASDGGIVDGRQLYGKKRLMVYWDWSDRVEVGEAVAFLRVLQKAQRDLRTKSVDIMFVHISFPTARKPAMNDTDLRAFVEKWSLPNDGGTERPPIPLYRGPNRTEYNAARELGMENAYTVMENLGESPTIVLLDEGGIVRWHSEGLAVPPPGAEVDRPDQYTIIEAVKFALEAL